MMKKLLHKYGLDIMTLQYVPVVVSNPTQKNSYLNTLHFIKQNPQYEQVYGWICIPYSCGQYGCDNHILQGHYVVKQKSRLLDTTPNFRDYKAVMFIPDNIIKPFSPVSSKPIFLSRTVGLGGCYECAAKTHQELNRKQLLKLLRIVD